LEDVTVVWSCLAYSLDRQPSLPVVEDHPITIILAFLLESTNPPGPILTPNGLEEYFVNEIIDSRHHGKGWQFLVRWLSYTPEHDLWLPLADLTECEALDKWYKAGGDGPDAR
jgi:Chromo (CHRromatin Organisation MOdifier) domain